MEPKGQGTTPSAPPPPAVASRCSSAAARGAPRRGNAGASPDADGGGAPSYSGGSVWVGSAWGRLDPAATTPPTGTASTGPGGSTGEVDPLPPREERPEEPPTRRRQAAALAGGCPPAGGVGGLPSTGGPVSLRGDDGADDDATCAAWCSSADVLRMSDTPAFVNRWAPPPPPPPPREGEHGLRRPPPGATDRSVRSSPRRTAAAASVGRRKGTRAGSPPARGGTATGEAGSGGSPAALSKSPTLTCELSRDVSGGAPPYSPSGRGIRPASGDTPSGGGPPRALPTVRPPAASASAAPARPDGEPGLPPRRRNATLSSLMSLTCHSR